ncbi:hypothetical protein A2303_01700 [Candidatus Falkowbacteria bacterium RIFOXYB2_FULL_47_14]|uniref:Uncharacterized protein n=1 Tax=Candidatus Falkowbacteria bacterium RIFOXYA2_FULL_47_19 TaxID=1797994 RepID=A0A1F5SLL4_9BACT|nr:MAG: hypothetical protein A2227_01775 [Candidatus Falkowbacteria bacterium RIFOXYA2_FULL_47_19]OGF36840.1 MAG: hypothetical protein A2468_07375 [Candidatus Falkowbacteria bacterium RIFOXYC2_FULL_46_15]OGF43494.1 MAG: hypothetical protein A2303_01700 [Candidatus Falkowbacteria bacterium RIFOXYB2_FULL_47_14]
MATTTFLFFKFFILLKYTPILSVELLVNGLRPFYWNIDLSSPNPPGADIGDPGLIRTDNYKHKT